MTNNNWDESKHPRDNDGKFTYKGLGETSTESDEEKIQRRADNLYGSDEEYYKKYPKKISNKTDGILTGGAASVGNSEKNRFALGAGIDDIYAPEINEGNLIADAKNIDDSELFQKVSMSDVSFQKPIFDEKLTEEIMSKSKYDKFETMLPYLKGHGESLKEGISPYKQYSKLDINWGKYNSTISESTKEKLKKFLIAKEICKNYAYQPTKNDLWTIGYGHTKGVKPGDKITQKQAEKYLDEDIKEHIKALKVINVPITENQKIALASLAFNMGETKFRKKDLVKYLNAGDYKKAADEFLLLTKSADGNLRGLVVRRNEENRIFSKDIPKP